MQISVVVPLYNEEESLPELATWIKKVMDANGFTYEIIFIDDGSKDRSWEVIQELSINNPSIKGISFRRNYGKSAALNVGFEHATGNVVITMDADLQDSPDEIPELYRLITEENFDLISGWKKKRYDPLSKTIPTKLFNWATRKLSGIELHDFNCGLKAYRYEVVKNIEVYGEMHRYIPVIAKWAGFKKIGEKVVQHQARKYGSSKFGLERFINGFLDLLSITFVSRFGKKPMHLFGLLGCIMFFIGFLFTLWMGIHKLWAQANGIRLRLITDDPLFYIALVMVILGTQLFLAGFLAEMIARNSPDRNLYRIKQKIGSF
ncbi:MAG: glycosyltransferase family 2 protein [Flavobacteriales bacterium]|nr:glycosyltransferase family 2 protein [Flavobacteriales bacterium]